MLFILGYIYNNGVLKMNKFYLLRFSCTDDNNTVVMIRENYLKRYGMPGQ